jgi:hypothetical protein
VPYGGHYLNVCGVCVTSDGARRKRADVDNVVDPLSCLDCAAVAFGTSVYDLCDRCVSPAQAQAASEFDDCSALSTTTATSTTATTTTTSGEPTTTTTTTTSSNQQTTTSTPSTTTLPPTTTTITTTTNVNQGQPLNTDDRQVNGGDASG